MNVWQNKKIQGKTFFSLKIFISLFIVTYILQHTRYTRIGMKANYLFSSASKRKKMTSAVRAIWNRNSVRVAINRKQFSIGTVYGNYK